MIFKKPVSETFETYSKIEMSILLRKSGLRPIKYCMSSSLQNSLYINCFTVDHYAKCVIKGLNDAFKRSNTIRYYFRRSCLPKHIVLRTKKDILESWCCLRKFIVI